jgi:hypothetical protein
MHHLGNEYASYFPIRAGNILVSARIFYRGQDPCQKSCTPQVRVGVAGKILFRSYTVVAGFLILGYPKA